MPVPTILVVDDHMAVRTMLREVYVGAGYQVITADHGRMRWTASLRPPSI